MSNSIKRKEPYEQGRRDRRVTFCNRVRLLNAGMRDEFKASNISRNGIFILTSNLFPIGSILNLEIDLNLLYTVRAQAVVRHHSTGVGIGVEFLLITLDDRTSIDLFVRRQPNYDPANS
ncbi:MAG: PilZ domain-containing protein [Acidobacteriota bacterium]